MSVEAQLQEVLGRWETFVTKVEERVAAILAEAGPGLDEIIATEVLDPAPLSGALTELRARWLGLVKKVDDAFEKLDGELDRIAEAAEGEQGPNVYRLRDELVRRRRALAKEIERRFEELSVHKAADGARALGELARKEMDQAAQGTKCASCGGSIRPTALTEPCNVVCEHCKAVNTVRPGAATLLYYQGIALHSLAAEAALEEAHALQAAEERFRWFRYPTDDDAHRYEEAAAAYWRAHCEAAGKLSPGWSPDRLEGEVQAKLGGLRDRLRGDARARSANTAALRLAHAGDQAGLSRWLQTSGSGLGLSDLLVAAHEHQDRPALELALELSYRAEGSKEAAERWKAERLAELDAALAAR